MDGKWGCGARGPGAEEGASGHLGVPPPVLLFENRRFVILISREFMETDVVCCGRAVVLLLHESFVVFVLKGQ